MRIIKLYEQMAALTEPECASCRVPHSCCEAMYCDLATERAQQFEVLLERQDHPTLPYMSPTGCVVPPYLRPLCTLHTCAINNLGLKPHDPVWTEEYFMLRGQIVMEEDL